MDPAIRRTPTLGGRSVLEGAFALLEALSDGEEKSLTLLATTAGLPKATAYRLLSQLVMEGAVQRRDGRYQLGPRIFRLGQTWQPARLPRTALAQPLRQLTASSTHGAFSLSVTDRGSLMVLGGVGREIDELYSFAPGMLLPPGTAAEQILCQAASEPLTPEGFSDQQWRRLTGSARELGLAYDLDTDRYGGACVAAPVRGPAGEIVAALAATTFEPQRIPALGDLVRRAAGVVTTNLTRLLRTGRAVSL